MLQPDQRRTQVVLRSEHEHAGGTRAVKRPVYGILAPAKSWRGGRLKWPCLYGGR
jgi:hypothetical protein